VDAIALMDALQIERAIVAGFDWGARTANIIAALWADRCKALVSVSGYLIGNQAAGKVPLPPGAERSPGLENATQLGGGCHGRQGGR
jgi:pimeloyl-ACP methyl ester carboxylesterase